MTEWAFDFGPGLPVEGYISVTPDTLYDESTGYGFEAEGRVYGGDRSLQAGCGSNHRASSIEADLRAGFCIPLGATFTVDVPDGTYRVSLVVGDEAAETYTELRAGESKMVLPPIMTLPGQFVNKMFSVPVTGGKLKLKFSGTTPRINALNITPAQEVITLYLAGDSTVTDQLSTGYPYAGWGQMLPCQFKHDVAVDNHAISGRSSRSFITEGRLDEIKQKIKKGDYLFIQFGHNDEKSDAARSTDPFTTYKEHLQQYIDAARVAEATPVLVTPVHRRFFNEDGTLSDTHGDYIPAMKELAGEQAVPLIDLAAESKQLFEAAGVEGSKDYFMWTYPGEYKNHPDGVEDNTHFQQLGALRLAEKVSDCIRALDLQPLRMFLR